MSERTFFVHLFAGFILIATGVHASCPIELSPPRVVVKYGDPVNVTCSTSETQHDGLGWEVTQGGTGVRLVNSLAWTVASLTLWEPSPMCFFSSKLIDQCTKTAEVVVYTFPQTINISSSSGPSGQMREGEDYVFRCHIDNVAPVQNVSVRWLSGDGLILTQQFENPKREPVNQVSELKFTPTRKDNGTLIRCQALMDLEPEGPQLMGTSEEFAVIVLFGPSVTCAEDENSSIIEGETLEERCSVTGNPNPTVRWFKDGEPIDPTVPLERQNAGRYTVKAEGLSSMEKEITVFILYGPELLCPSNYTALEYARHNLTCIVEGFPRPETTWYKEGEEVELPEILTRRDAGQYVISASNDIFSDVNVTVDVVVLYPPSLIVELEDSEIDVGSTMWLKCSSTGNPRPKYSWIYYQADNVMEESEDGVSRLIIHNATANNMGLYTCHAWNKEGHVSKTVEVTVKGAEQECPIRITPDTMVVQYQSRERRATCESSSNSPSNVIDISWRLEENDKVTIMHNNSWFPDTHQGWDSKPVCTATFQGLGTCNKHLNFILYKTPDSVSIRRVDNSSFVLEDQEFQLQCDIVSVAPAQLLSVLWYRGSENIGPGVVQMTDCQPGKTSCNISEIRSPVNVLSTIFTTLNRAHNVSELRCEAHLNLGLERTQHPPSMESTPLNLTVLYKPMINTTKLPKTVPLFRGYPEELVCEADGRPAPKIQWLYSSDKTVKVSEGVLTVYEAGIYNCSARNDVDSTLHVVEVILKEDYLPLIAGFVAVTVIVISVIFIFIYSIYYKNTKMRRYSLKNPKLSTHNGNVAHNGWDLPLPMTKLS